MQARVLQSPTSGKTLVQVKMDHGEVFGLDPRDLIAEIRTCLAEKISQSLFEKVDPVILKALSDVETNSGQPGRTTD